MAYVPLEWVNNPPSAATPLNADNLNHMETQYDEAVAFVSASLMGGKKLVSLTAAQYAALPVKDSNTVYFVTA